MGPASCLKNCTLIDKHFDAVRPPVETKNKDDEQQRFIFSSLTAQKIFASLAKIKAYYALLQFGLFPYNAVLISHMDKLIVNEFGSLFSFKSLHACREHAFSGDEFILAMCRELSACSRTYKTILKKLNFRTRSLASEISRLGEELDQKNTRNKALLGTTRYSGSFSVTEDEGVEQLRMMRMSYFISELRHTVRSIRHFVKVVVNRMRLAGWDLKAAADALQPGLSYRGTTDICFAFEAYICSEMFEAFQFPNFGLSKETSPQPKLWRSYFARQYLKLKSMNPADYLSNNPDCSLATFFRLRYQRVIHPKMELSLFGNINFRNHINLGGVPEAPFVNSFLQMAKRVLRLHYLALSMDPDASVFQVPKGCRFSQVYMESVHQDQFQFPHNSSSHVAFTVVPGFKLCWTIVQCEVYLSNC